MPFSLQVFTLAEIRKKEKKAYYYQGQQIIKQENQFHKPDFDT